MKNELSNFEKNQKKVIKIYVCVRFRPGGQLAITAPVLKTGGKPSTWLPPGGLVEQKNLSTLFFD